MGLTPAEREALRAGAGRFGEQLNAGAFDAFDGFVSEVERWNDRANLLGPDEREELVERHLVDSLAAMPVLRGSHKAGMRILDVGSGGGFPGVPLAIVLANASLVLVEPRRRRASFLRAVARVLPESRLEVSNDRVEELAERPGLRQSFDALVMRAALPIADFLLAAERLLVPGGMAIAYRGVAVDEGELDPSGVMGAPERIRYRVPERSGDFSLLIWRKRSS